MDQIKLVFELEQCKQASISYDAYGAIHWQHFPVWVLFSTINERKLRKSIKNKHIFESVLYMYILAFHFLFAIL